MKSQINISAEPFAIVKWYSATITFEQDGAEEKFEASIAVSKDENIGSRILEITFNDDLPEQVDEEEIKQLITNQFNRLED
jgi:hypothetical protein